MTNLKLFENARLSLSRVDVAESLILGAEVNAGYDRITNLQSIQQCVVDEYVLLLHSQ